MPSVPPSDRADGWLAEILRATGTGTWDWDCQSGHVTLGTEWLAHLGYTAGDIPPTPDGVFDLVHPDDRARATRALRGHLEGQTAEGECVGRLRRKDGTYQWRRERFRVVARADDGTARRMVGLGTNITDLGQAGDRAHPWEHIFDQTQFGLGVVSAADDTFIAVNEAYAVMHGYTVDELIGQHVSLTCAPDTLADLPAIIARAHTAGRIVGQFQHRRKDGTTFPTLHEVSVAHDAQGRVVSRVGFVVDVTEREQALAALRRSEARFRAAYRNASVGMVISDAEGRSVEVNPVACAMLGVREDDLHGVPFQDLTHPDDVADSRARRARLFSGQSEHEVFEKRYVRRDGSTMWAQVGLSLIHAGDGEAPHVLALIEDISSRRQAHEALREREHQLHLALDAANAGTFAFDVPESIANFSARCREFYGFTPGQGISPADVTARTHPADRALVAEQFARALATGSDYDVEYRVVAPGQPPRWLHARGRAVYDAQGQVRQMVGVKHDITASKEAFDRLRSSEERFRLVAEATRDVLYDWDITTNQHWWSPNAVALFGHVPNREGDISAWTSRLHDDDRRRVVRDVEAAVGGTAGSWDGEYRFRLADGSYGEILDRGHIVRDDHGRAIRMIGAMTNVTELKRAHRSVLDTHERLRAVSREVHLAESRERAALARELHDEFGQLLTAAKLSASWLRSHAPDVPDAARAQYAEKTESLCDVLDMALHGVRHVASQLRPPALDQLGLPRAIEGLAAQVERHAGFECQVHIDDVTRATVFGPVEGAALYRIAQELLTNAARHAQARHVVVRLATAGDGVTLEVRDDGQGFAPDTGRAASTWGLKGVRERTELLGGRMQLESQAGGGTTVRITIPHGAGA